MGLFAPLHSKVIFTMFWYSPTSQTQRWGRGCVCWLGEWGCFGGQWTGWEGASKPAEEVPGPPLHPCSHGNQSGASVWCEPQIKEIKQRKTAGRYGNMGYNQTERLMAQADKKHVEVWRGAKRPLSPADRDIWTRRKKQVYGLEKTKHEDGKEINGQTKIVKPPDWQRHGSGRTKWKTDTAFQSTDTHQSVRQTLRAKEGSKPAWWTPVQRLLTWSPCDARNTH